MFVRARAVVGTFAVVLAVTLAVTLAGTLAAGAPTEAAAKPPQAPRPVVRTLTPASGPVVGGITVTIRGRHLRHVRTVLFGHAEGTGLQVLSGRRLTVVAPSGAAGVVDVRVVGRHRRSRAGEATFTYRYQPPLPPPPPPFRQLARSSQRAEPLPAGPHSS